MSKSFKQRDKENASLLTEIEDHITQARNKAMRLHGGGADYQILSYLLEQAQDIATKYCDQAHFGAGELRNAPPVTPDKETLEAMLPSIDVLRGSNS